MRPPHRTATCCTSRPAQTASSMNSASAPPARSRRSAASRSRTPLAVRGSQRPDPGRYCGGAGPLTGTHRARFVSIHAPRIRWARSRKPPADEDLQLLMRLRSGDEDAFVAIVGRHHDAMLRLAKTFVHSHAVAEVDASRFDSTGAWSSPPEQWVDDVEERIGAEALRSQIVAALTDMPERQRAVVMLRDVDGLRSDEVCQVLDLTPANERVLLHRGRSRLRQALEDKIGASGA